MSTTIKMTFARIGAASLATTMAVAGLSGCEQQRAACASAHGAYTVKLTVRSNPDSCPESPGGVYGLATYNYEKDGRPDFDRTRVAIQDEEFGIIVGDAEFRLGDVVDPANKLFALGDFAAPEPNGRGVCEVPNLAPAKKAIPVQPAIPDDPETPDEDESLPEIPAMSFEYAWSALKFLVSEANQGTRFTGTLDLTVDGCTVQYDAVGLYPAVYCGDDDGNPEDGFCSAEPIAELGMILGSGISPDFQTQCDPVLLLCVLKERPPTD